MSEFGVVIVLMVIVSSVKQNGFFPTNNHGGTVVTNGRIRSIKPEYFQHETLFDLDSKNKTGGLLRLAFAGLWLYSDRRGVCKDRPRRLKNFILPYDDCDFDALLQILHDGGFITRYEVNGDRYIHVLNFKRHQRPHKKESASDCPGPDHPDAEVISDRRTQDRDTPETGPQPDHGPESPVHDRTEPGKGCGGSGSGSGSGSGIGSKSLKPSVGNLAVLTLPVRGGGEFPVLENDVKDWNLKYPEFTEAEIHAQFRDMLNWMKAKPERKKTTRGMPKFINGWLQRSAEKRREQDRKDAVREKNPVGRLSQVTQRALDRAAQRERSREETGSDSSIGGDLGLLPAP